MLTRLLLLGACALLLAGCGTSRPASVADGECKIAHTPEYAILGKTTFDQDWIDDTTERLVAGCNQPRPKPRPEAWDANGNKVEEPAKVDTPTPVKKRWFDRFRRK